MRKVSSFVLILLFCSFWVAFLKIKVVKAESKIDSGFVLSPVEYTNVTSHTGDIVLEGTDVLHIKDAKFELNGSLLMSGDSTLILDNAELYPVFGRWQESYELHDNAKIIMKRGSLISSMIFDFRLYDNSLLNVTDSEVEKSVYGEPHARVQAYNSHLQIVSLIADYRGGGYLTMINSSAGSVSCSGDAQIINSSVENFGVAINARIVDSQIGSLEVIGGNMQPPITCCLINSTYVDIDKNAFQAGVIYVGWHLTVSVESEGQPIEGANVEAYYLHNGSLAEQKETQSNGKVQFDLMEWEITELGSQYVGNYRVKVSYDTTETEETIKLTSSQELIIPEFPSWTPLLTTLVALVAIAVVYRHKLNKHNQRRL